VLSSNLNNLKMNYLSGSDGFLLGWKEVRINVVAIEFYF